MHFSIALSCCLDAPAITLSPPLSCFVVLPSWWIVVCPHCSHRIDTSGRLIVLPGSPTLSSRRRFFARHALLSPSHRRLSAFRYLAVSLPSHCRLAPARISRSVLPSWCLAACHRLTILPCPRCLPPFCPGVHKSYRLARSLHRLPPCIVVYCCVLLCMHFAFWYIIKYRNKSDWVTSPSLLVASSGWLHHCSQYFVTAVIESWLPVGIEGSLLGNTLAALGLATGKVG